MDTVSQMPDARTRKTFGLLLKGLAAIGGDRAAEIFDVDASTVSRWKAPNAQFERIARFLTAIGYKTVPVSYRCVDEQEYALLKRWAIQRLEQQEEHDTGIHWEQAR